MQVVAIVYGTVMVTGTDTDALSAVVAWTDAVLVTGMPLDAQSGESPAGTVSAICTE